MTMTMNHCTSVKLKVSNWIIGLTLFSAGLLGSTVSALADSPALPAGSVASAALPQPPLGQLFQYIPVILMVGVLYFLVLRPQQKKLKEQQEMIGSLKRGDSIVTNSGFLGKVAGITDEWLTVELADNVRVKMLKNQVSRLDKDVKEVAK